MKGKVTVLRSDLEEELTQWSKENQIFLMCPGLGKAALPWKEAIAPENFEIILLRALIYSHTLLTPVPIHRHSQRRNL